MFTYGGSDPSNNEIDIEASHWGDMSTPTGSGTVWQDANANVSEGRVFDYSSRPPYVNQFIWSPGRIDYLVTDATGATLFAWTVTTGVPTPSTEVPFINYWRFNNVAPAGVRTMRISSFAWAPLGQSLPPPTNPAGPGPTPAGPGAGAGGSGSPSMPAPPGALGAPPTHPRGGSLTCVVGVRTTGARGRHSARPVDVTVFMQPSLLPVASLPGAGVLRWTATGPAGIDLIIRRWVRSAGFVRMGVLRRSVHAGLGRIRLPHQLGGRAFGRGTYSVGLTSAVRPVRCARRHFAFTVT